MAPILAFFTFLVVAALFLGLWLFTGGGSKQEMIRRRVEAVQRAERRGHTSLELKLMRDEMLSDVPIVHQLLLRWSWSTRLRDILYQAGMNTKPAKVILLCAVLALGIFLAVGKFFDSTIIGLAAAAAAGLAPLAYIALKRKLRLRAFERHFPEALDLLSRAVRAGHAFATGLKMIATETPEPLSTEFRIAFEEQNFGLPLRDALINLAERVPLIDVRFFVTSLLVQKETGGNLAEILDGLARVIRERFKIRGEVRTRTAQGRLSAAILLSLPPVMMLILGALNPDYIHPLYSDPVGPLLMWGAFGLQLIGTIWIWKIVNIEV